MKRQLFLFLSVLCALVFAGRASAAFTDVTPGAWYEAAVTEMEQAGLLSGYPDGRFGPGDPISAAQFVSAAARCAGLEPVQGQTGHWASGALQAALQAGWYDWDELPPTGEGFDRPISRQLAVKILMRALLPQVRGDFNTESPKLKDFPQLDGRYYEPVLAAYAAGVVRGDADGNFHPKSSLSRAEACIMLQKAMKLAGGAPLEPEDPVPPEQPAVKVGGGVSENGWLQVKGAQLCNETGEPVVLRGMSSHGLHWYEQYTNRQSIQNTAQFGANLFRVAMYTEAGGYLSNPDAVTDMLIRAVDAAIESDMYAIIDWHILSDGNPMSHAAEAREFFSKIARRYQDSPAVLYELCNEPNGDVTWERDVKPYAQQIIPAIREYAPRSVILVGSSTWSQDLYMVSQSPLEGENLMYTFHFYAGTHGAGLRQRVERVLDAGLPVFVTEWGTSRADGSGGVFLKESEEWLDFLNKRGVSWANWSLCDKDETSAALRPGASPNAAWTQADLSESGNYVFSKFKG